ncbi:hypothetical protein [Roseivirga sp. UBA1976]|uniref:hypothetical protein n=1 Tax=Roseivirga sp. UBA1976 TaxID=1947386 RepID=UPI002580644B|nr:hypothetical protein [Roseivirga sp. UBA1976]|tara:strand:+ start:9989 stop:10309 length:321 start_codon:yes stop_codon:yes gene_type:complete
MAGGVLGFNLDTTPVVGFLGFSVGLDGLTPVQVKDRKGKVLSNVTLEAENATSGVPFENTTDATGTALMQLDNPTTITAKKDLVEVDTAFAGENTLVIELDDDLMI